MYAPKRLRIGLIPYESGVNLYAQRMRAVLADFGEVVPAGTPLQRVARMFSRTPSFDLTIVGWVENALVTRSGRLSSLGLSKMVAQALVLRAQSRRLIYVRHNRYPHTARARYAGLMTRVLDLYERLFDLAVTHSPAEACSRRAYCPHPLYETLGNPERRPELPPELSIEPGYCVVFGRIAPYKQIERLLSNFPASQRLIVAGVADDDAYVAQLSRLRRPNIVVAPGFLSEAQAQRLVSGAAAVVVCHAADDVIVSGSFFYAMSLQRPVFAVATPFLRSIQEQVGPRVLQLAHDVPALCVQLGALSEHPMPGDADWEAVHTAFGDHSVSRHLVQLFGRLGLLQIARVDHQPVVDVAE